MIEAVKSVFANFADFSGRASRAEFWWFFLFVIIAVVGLVFVDASLGFASSLIFALIIFVPSLSVTVRRLHDTGHSGWWYFISLVPLIGSIWLLILLITAGDSGWNEYGAPPTV